MRTASVYDETTLDELKAIASSMNLDAQVKTGDNVLACTLPSGDALVFVHGARGGPVGDMIVFAARLDGARADEAKAGAWNRAHNFATVTIDRDGTPWVAMQVLLAGGVTGDFLRMRFAVFDVVLADFRRAFAG